MKSRPILFNAEMVKAILDDRKTQTRRVIKPQIQSEEMVNIGARQYQPWTGDCFVGKAVGCPFGQPGDQLWVRETWTTRKGLDSTKPSEINPEQSIGYIADEEGPWLGKTRPSIFMPRWASRITLEVTGVRVERVQEITESDARAEGIVDGGCLNCGESEPCGCNDPQPDARDAFAYLWDSINAKRSFEWITNPWVWVIEFKRVEI